MSNVRVQIDNWTPNDQPLGLKNFRLNVRYNPDERTILNDTNTAVLRFVGDAYDYLYKSMLKDGYNGVHSINLQVRLSTGTFSTIFTGNLFVSDCEFDLERSICETQIMDAGYNSYIRNNRELEPNITYAYTKNGTAMSSAYLPTEDTVELINPPSNTVPATGINVGTGTSRTFYRVETVLAFLVYHISDLKLAFSSSYFENIYNTEGTRFGLVTGKMLRTNTSDEISRISFKDLWEDLANVFNMIMTVSTATGTATVKCEHRDYFYNSKVAVDIKNTRAVKRSFMQDLLYSNIEFGSAASITDGSAGALTYIPPFDFGSDSYHITGVGNIDNDLRANCTKLITDSNIIEDVITNDNDGYDDQWFLIAYNGDTLEAWTTQSEIFQDGAYYYNGEFTNYAVMQRYTVQGAAVKSVGTPDGDFQALKGTVTSSDLGTPASMLVDHNYDTILGDPSSSWSTATNKYTATTNAIRNVKTEVHTRLTANMTPNAIGQDIFVYTVRTDYYLNGTLLFDFYDWLSAGFSYPHEAIHLVQYDPNQQQFEKSQRAMPIYMTIGDELTIKHQIRVGSMTNDIRQYFANKSTIYMRDIPLVFDNPLVPASNWRYLNEYSEINIAAGTGLFDTIQSTAIQVLTQGSMNGLPIAAEKQDSFFINQFKFNDKMTANEMNDFLNNPEKAISLKSQKLNLNTKTWASNVVIDLNNGMTKFEVFNNLNNL